MQDTQTGNRPLTRSQQRNQKALEGFAKGIAILIIIGVAAFAEIAFLGMISKMFPDNPIFKAAAIVGAVATGMSVVTLLFAKLKWIRAGGQHWISWAFFALEITIMVLNLILSFELAGTTPQHLDQWMQAYYQVMPATPIVAMIGWTLIFMTDRSKERFDAERDLQDELEDAELDHKREQHTILMGVRRSINHIHADQLMREVETRAPDIQRITQEVVAREIESLIGIYVPRNTVARTIDSTISTPGLPAPKPASFAKTGTLNRPNALPESDTSDKRNLFNKIKDGVSSGLDAIRETGTPDGVNEQVTESEVSPAKPAPKPFHAGNSTATNDAQRQRIKSRRARRAKRSQQRTTPGTPQDM